MAVDRTTGLADVVRAAERVSPTDPPIIDAVPPAPRCSAPPTTKRPPPGRRPRHDHTARSTLSRPRATSVLEPSRCLSAPSAGTGEGRPVGTVPHVDEGREDGPGAGVFQLAHGVAAGAHADGGEPQPFRCS